jgi:hypothetical protein
MRAKFIVRLVGDDGALLAWTEVVATASPQGRPRSTPFKAIGPSHFVIERDGVAAALIIHWADLDVVRKTTLMNPSAVQAGQVQRFDWIEPVWMVKGSERDIPLEPVTVRSPVSVGVPAGSLRAMSQA